MVCRAHAIRLFRPFFQTGWLSYLRLRWGLAGLGLIGLHLALVLISSSFAYENELRAKPVIVLVAIQVVSGILFLGAVCGIPEERPNKRMLCWIVLVGALMRAGMLFSTPMLEDDFYRYLWDGAVTAKGVNPWSFPPSQVFSGGAAPARLRSLAAQGEAVFSRINHSHLRSIYPPVAQAAFAFAYFIDPWKVLAWRLVLLIADGATLFLLVLLLRAVKLPLIYLLVYWWNPLLVKEIFNSNHMDLLVLPFVLGSVLLSLRGRHAAAAASLALAVGTKLWPILLFPLISRPIWSKPKRLVPALWVFGIVSLILFLPVYSTLDNSSGLIVYGQRWEMNDGLYMVILWGVQLVLKGSGSFVDHSQLITRLVVLVLLLGWIFWLARKEIAAPIELCERFLWAVAAIFLLSPTQFPWYYLWLLPFLVIRPKPPLLLLTALLPLYYLRFYFDARDRVEIFDFGIVWVEYVPVWILLFREYYLTRHRETRRANLFLEATA